MTSTRALPALLGLTASILLLAGCATPASPVPSPSSTPTPSATPVDPVVEPASVFDLECADLVTPEDIESLALWQPVTVASDEPLSTLPGGTGPLAYGTQQLGGLHCEWNNGKDYYADETGSPSELYAGVLVNALPHATAEWPKYLANYKQEASTANCHDIAATWRCEQNDLVGDVWLRVTVSGVTAGSETQASAAAAAVFARVTSAIAASPRTPQADWMPADTIGLDGSCERFGQPAEITALLGLDTEMVWVRPAGGWSLEASTWDMMRSAPCLIGAPHADYSVAVIDWLPAGEWAWRKAERTGTPLSLSGMGEDDHARLECLDDGRCIADMLVGRNWIRIEMFSPTDSLPEFRVADELPAATTALAQHIVTKLRG
ncbi:hypothetical protein CLV46_1042 [Diaminobutyricimonas aerilata]|uniref:DUF3558 domain-containing protein n=1 Tax=Diaminobutyricimonas aerilata TaxID=1162967 RepID=A0A2M9CHU8_9MICO|nr:hypothetical protein [Diaminobutyricimonas aerilata]PJJ71493.1 hypothetical protein CLV46_1042 [Diaminobutyricimonas aerilata]